MSNTTLGLNSFNWLLKWLIFKVDKKVVIEVGIWTDGDYLSWRVLSQINTFWPMKTINDDEPKNKSHSTVPLIWLHQHFFISFNFFNLFIYLYLCVMSIYDNINPRI